MKKLIILLLLAPILLLSQPYFNVTDNNGNTWDSDEILEQGTTIIVQFFSPSMTCWPSSNSVENLNKAYESYYGCNDIFFIQVAEWGNEAQVNAFIEEFGNPSIPYVIGYDQGQTLTFDWMEWGLEWASECWLVRPDGSYEYDIPFMWDLEQQALIDVLENEGFVTCDHTTDLEDGFLESWPHPGPSGCCTHCDAMGEYTLPDKQCVGPIYDLQGRLLNEKPKSGFYIQGGLKHYITK